MIARMEEQPKPNAVAWLVFLLGIGSIPLWILMGGHGASAGLRQVQSLLWFMSMAACVAAPFLSTLPINKKWIFAVLALVAALGVTAATLFVYIVMNPPIG